MSNFYKLLTEDPEHYFAELQAHNGLPMSEAGREACVSILELVKAAYTEAFHAGYKAGTQAAQASKT